MICDKGAAVFLLACRIPERDQILEIFQPAARNRAMASQAGWDSMTGTVWIRHPSNAAFVAFLTRGVRRELHGFPFNIIELSLINLLALVLLKKA